MSDTAVPRFALLQELNQIGHCNFARIPGSAGGLLSIKIIGAVM